MYTSDLDSELSEAPAPAEEDELAVANRLHQQNDEFDVEQQQHLMHKQASLSQAAASACAGTCRADDRTAVAKPYAKAVSDPWRPAKKSAKPAASTTVQTARSGPFRPAA